MTDLPLPPNRTDIKPLLYGARTFGDLFTPRQLVAITTFSDLVGEARARIREDDHAAAVAPYLGITVDRLCDRGSMICAWDVSRDTVRGTFARQALPMIWDYAEGNPLGGASGGWEGQVHYLARCLRGPR